MARRSNDAAARQFRGFEILSRGKSGGFGLLQEDERIPDLFVRGRATYSANLNPANPIGTVQSIEHTLRNLDKLAADQQNRVARVEKELADYRSQADRPFEHEERLKQLLARQAELNSLLDLDKGDQQGAGPAPEIRKNRVWRGEPAAPRGRDEVAKMAEAYMRASGTAIREMPISERTPPQTGQLPAERLRRMKRISRLRLRRTAFFSIVEFSGRTYRSANDCLCAFIRVVLRSTTLAIEGDEILTLAATE